MSRWEENFDNHPVHEALTQLRDWVESRDDELKSGETSERRRFLKTIDALENILSKVDKELAPTNHLDSLNNNLRHQNIWNQAQGYFNSGQVQNLINSNNHMVGPLASLSIFRGLTRSDDIQIDIKRIESQIDEVSDFLSRKKNESLDRLQELNDEVDYSRKVLDDLEKQVESRRSEVNSQMSKWQEQFSESQEKRLSYFSGIVEKAEQDFLSEKREVLDNAESEFNRHATHLSDRSKDILADSESKHKAILELYGLAAGDTVGGGYQKTADEEGGKANNWRRLSIVFVVLTAGWLLYVYGHPPIDSDPQSVVWARLITVFSMSAVLLGGAVFSARQSNRHRDDEKRSRWFALQVKAIDPFLSSLERSEQSRIKSALSEKMFSNGVDQSGDRKPVRSDYLSEDFVVRVVDTLAQYSRHNN